MSTLFARHSPAARLRAAYRRHRSTPQRSLTGPLVLAASLAAGGHLVATRAELDLPTVDASSSAAAPLAARPDFRLEALLGETSRPATEAATSPFGRTFNRASRGEARVAVAAPRAAAKAAPKPKPKPKRKPRWHRPSGGALTSPYGTRWGRMHNGLDFGAPQGSPVRAAFDGVVVFAGYDGGGYGKQIRIRHYSGVTTTYSHLSKFVVTGGRVQAGQLIGKVGSTGNSTGPHLHFEILVRGANVNPRPFLAARGVRV